MRFLQIFSIALFIFMPNTPLAAQEHQHHAQTQANPPGFQQYMEMLGKTKEQRFSYWGYRHMELHKLGLVAKLRAATNQNCCDGEDENNGECRVSIVDLPSRQVMVDGEWCPYYEGTKIAVIGELESLRDGKESIAMVCAGVTNRVNSAVENRRCPSVYCIGIPPVKM